MCLSDLFRILGEKTKKKLVSPDDSLIVESAILSKTVPSASVNLRSHKHGQNRKKWKPYSVGTLLSSVFLIWATDRWNGNTTELSPIQSEIIPVFKKIGRARAGV